MSLPHDPRAWLFDVEQAIARVQRFLRGKDFAAYQVDDLLRAGVERQFEIMGEALNQLRRLDAVLVAAIRDHARIIGFRNLLVHGYAVVDDSIVWDIASAQLGPLQADVRALLERLDRQAPKDSP